LALLANTAPVAFGSIGIPITTLGGLVAPILGHTDAVSTTRALSAMVGRQLPLFSVLIPAYLIVVLAGWRRMREILPAVLLTGVSFAVVQFLISNYVGPELTDILAALVSMGCLALLLRVWKPAQTFRFKDEPATAPPMAQPRPVMGASSDLPGEAAATRAPAQKPASPLAAYFMYVVLVVVILIGQMGNLPGLTKLTTPTNLSADLKCGTPAFKLWPTPWFGPTATADRQAFNFPAWNFFWPGSDTSSNTLFGPLQAQTAQQLGNVSPILTAGTNSSGGVMGKMISPQNLSVGAAGVNKVGAEGAIFARVIKYSLILTTLVGIVAMIEAYVLPGIIPSP